MKLNDLNITIINTYNKIRCKGICTEPLLHRLKIGKTKETKINIYT